MQLSPRAAKVRRKVLSGFWFLPAALSLAGVLLALSIPALDGVPAFRALDASALVRRLDGGPDGARDVLTTGIAALATILGVAFSLTLVTLQLATAQYSSRILSSFMRDRVTRGVLGVFVGAITYLVLVLTTIGSRDEARQGPAVRLLSLSAAVLLFLVCIWAFAYFLSHLADAIEAGTVIANVGKETIAQARRAATAAAEERRAPEPGERPAFVYAESPGYLQLVDAPRLLRAAPRGARVVRVEVAVGDFLLPGMPLVAVWPAGELTGAEARRIRGAFAVGRHRTHEQDVLLGVRQLADMALRALSPGVNDVTTALMVVNELATVALAVMEASGDGGDFQALRRRGVTVLVPRVGVDAVLDHAFAEIPRAAREHPRILVRTLEVLTHLATLARSPGERASVEVAAERVREVLAASSLDAWERGLLDRRWRALHDALAPRAPGPPAPQRAAARRSIRIDGDGPGPSAEPHGP